ncbi:Subtilase family protein [Novipirellula aureliae]|uniref:Subtilase family protein n=1 Tax=Novipirellula aureliae TaxID=2527966 RepID=A0A5C6E6N1_9BACT|nr:S8 family peptidase [Novipirellula aureliae]TWU43301.1 Subtilase family protein [Novipirellula aureliae]
MNSEFPPKYLPEPTYLNRRPEKPRRQPLAPEVLARRGEIARVLGIKVDSLNRLLNGLTNEQRKAIFFKVTHDGPIDLAGTGLKPLVDRSENVTLVVPRNDDLSAFTAKLDRFANNEPTGPGYVTGQDFARIEDLERGDPKDRLSDELLADYDSIIKIKQPTFICEIEILSLAQGPKQRVNEIAEILQDLNNAFASGVHGTLFEHERSSGVCRAVIRCSGAMFKRLVEEDRWQRRIAWFEPKPKFETFHTTWHRFQFDKLDEIAPPPEDAPIICVVDSGVSPGNPFLKPVAKDDLIVSFLKSAPDSPYDEVGHGSGVASLAAYYVLNLAEGASNQATAWIASARILDDTNQIEESRLFSRVLEDVVKHFAPLGVRIFNLSVADLAKKWNQDSKRTQSRTSWTARTIDRLSREYDVVFVVATGNISPPVILDSLKAGNDYPVYLCDEDSRILDPGQAALAVSVGSVSSGTLVAHSPDTTLALQYEPSPFTRSGPGIKRETKPELVEIGGNLVSDVERTSVRANLATNVVMASHQLSPAAAHNYGTSFAAPRIANKLAAILQDLQLMGIEPIRAPLLKAFLVNSATYRGELDRVIESLDAVEKKKWLDVLGYGFPDASQATDCDDFSILLFHQGTIEPDKVAFFDIPIPASLSQSTGKKRITVTLAHFPEVQKWGLESYFGADLKWRMFRGNVDREAVVEAMSASSTDDDIESEASDIELPNEVPFEHKITRRSRGSIQHDWHEWSQHRDAYSDNHYTLAIASHKRWARAVEPIPFAVVIRIEDIGATVPIYTEIANAVDIMVQTRTRG